MQKIFTFPFRSKIRNQRDREIQPHLPAIDKVIAKAAPDWPVGKIARIDLAILRLALWELLIVKKEPAKVIIDEAVELAKEYGNDHSPKFINGALGTVLKKVAGVSEVSDVS